MGDVWVRTVDGDLIRESAIIRISASAMEVRVWPLDNPESSVQVAADSGGAAVPEGFDARLAGELVRWRSDTGSPLVLLEAVCEDGAWRWEPVRPVEFR